MGEPVPAVTVAPWGTSQSLPKDPSAPLHDCLWDIALEQAILARMKKTGADWTSASKQVTQAELRKHLDTVCDDNGFRRIDGTGSGRDPNLILDGERIKVRIAPTDLTQPAPGVDGKPAQTAYNKAITGRTGEVDINKKTQLDDFLHGVPGFQKMPQDAKAALIEAYTRKGVDHDKLTKLAKSDAFTSLSGPGEQARVLALYGTDETVTARIDKLSDGPADVGKKNLLELMATEGFTKLTHDQRKQLLDRYSGDGEFRAAIDKIVAKDEFSSLSGEAEAHALDILRRYSSRKGEGYGEVDKKNRTAVLVALFDQVLTDGKFKLAETKDGRETKAQTEAIDTFADDKAQGIKAN